MEELIDDVVESIFGPVIDKTPFRIALTLLIGIVLCLIVAYCAQSHTVVQG